jgi:predicted outer membrane protein
MENFRNYAIATLAACAIAVNSTSNNTQTVEKDLNILISQQRDTLSTEQFIKQLSTYSAKEINLSKLAKKKSKNSKVREYAVKAMDASIMVYSDLKPFAEPRNITLADSTTFVPDQLISVLKKANHNDFDRQYLSITIEDHNQTISLLEKGAMFGDTAIVSFANKQLVVFRRNLEEANFLSKQVGNKKMTADKPRKEKMR